MNNSGNVMLHRLLFDSTLSKTIGALYITISVAFVICNSFICLLFCKDKSLRKPFNILLLNLSLVDIASAFAIQPYIWVDFTKLGGDSAFASFLCASSVGLVFYISCGITYSLTLSCTTILRYLGIVRNCQGRILTSNTIVTSFCAMTWVIGAGSSLPNGISFQYNEIDAICYRQWPKGVSGNLYSLLITMMFFAIPVLTMIICCAALVVHIWKRSLEVPRMNIAAVRPRKSVAMLVGFLILALIICWSPFITIWILGRASDYFPNREYGEYKRQRRLRVGMIFPLFNSVLDPFIYTFSIQEDRKGVLQLLCGPCRRKMPTRCVKAFKVNA